MGEFIVNMEEGLYLEVTCPHCHSDFIDIVGQTEDGVEYVCKSCEEIFESYEVEDFADEDDWKVLDEEMRIALLGE